MPIRRLMLAAGAASGLVVLAVVLREYTSLAFLVERETQLRQTIAGHPVQSWLIGFGIYFLTSLVPLTGGKSMVFGWLFGLIPAVLMIDMALTLSALVTFLLSRYLIRDAIESRFGVHVQRLNGHLKRDGAFYLLFLRMAHTPYTFLNYVSGALRIETRTFWWTTQVGLLPGTIVFAFAGSRVPTLRELSEQGVAGLLDPWLFAALVLSGILPPAVRQSLRWCGLLGGSPDSHRTVSTPDAGRAGETDPLTDQSSAGRPRCFSSENETVRTK